MKMFIRHLTVAVIITVATSSIGYAWSYYVPLEYVVAQNDFVGTETFSAGTVISFLPDGTRSVTIEGIQYFISGGNWFLAIARGGVQYIVVLAPV